MGALVSAGRSRVRALFLVTLGVGGDGPGDTPEEVTRYFADDGNRNAEFFVFFLLVAAALAFLWFLGALRGVLVRADAIRRAGRRSPSAQASRARPC